VLGLIGPNGAGKTTLFECMAGLLPVDRGTVSHGDRSLPLNERACHLFYVPDSVAPWPAQTVRWALDFVIGFFDGAAARRDEVIQQLALGELLTSPIGTLSKGQRKRVALAIGLLTPQRTLLIDEPSTAWICDRTASWPRRCARTLPEAARCSCPFDLLAINGEALR
jgi:ABC-type multidrug transport system ATPase subunit